MEKAALTKALERFHEKSVDLDRRGGPEEDGELFEEVLELMDDILESFGLAATEDNQRLLESLAADKLAPPELIITLFQKKAEAEPNISPLERFAAGVMNGESPYNVLPAMGFVTHIYTLYLYELARKHPQALVEIYNELYRANPYLDEIGRLAVQVARLEEDGLRFLREFLRAGVF